MNNDDPNELVATVGSSASGPALVRCPYCGSTQFFGRRRVTTLGWLLYGVALLNMVVSVLLMFVVVGFCTMFLSPLLAVWGFYGCREHINTCANCKRDF